VRSVWQYTTSFVHAHDRNCLTRGSSNYKPQCVLPAAGEDKANGAFCAVNGSIGSHWYYPVSLASLDTNASVMMRPLTTSRVDWG